MRIIILPAYLRILQYSHDSEKSKKITIVIFPLKGICIFSEKKRILFFQILLKHILVLEYLKSNVIFESEKKVQLFIERVTK